LQPVDALGRQGAYPFAVALAQPHGERAQFRQLLFQFMGLLAQAVQTGQARATLEGMQAAQQFVHRHIGRGRPVRQGLVHADQQVLGFLDEDLEDFRIGVGIEDRCRHHGRGGHAGRQWLAAVIAQGRDEIGGRDRGLAPG